MGYYLQTPETHGKAEFLCEEYGGEIINSQEAEELMNDLESTAVVCVVNNGIFEAAGYCFSENEFKAFSRPGDTRPKTWLKFNNVAEIRLKCGFDN